MKSRAWVAIFCLAAVHLLAQPKNCAPPNANNPADHARNPISLQNNQKSATKDEAANNSPPRWYAALKRPEWLLIIVAAITAGFICWQSTETRRAAKAAQASVELQKVAMGQWIDTDDWTVGTYIQPLGGTEGYLPISFHVRNPTKFKLTLISIELWLDREFRTKISYRELLLPPDKYVSEGIKYPLNGVKLADYRNGSLLFEVGGLVCFVDAFNEKREQLFGYHCYSGRSSRGEFSPVAFNPPSKEEEKRQKERRKNRN